MKNIRWITGYEGLYAIKLDNTGWSSIISFHRNKPIRLKPFRSSTGYLQCTFSKNGIKTKEDIHRVVAKNFIPNPGNKPEVNHKDGVKENYNIDNLEWVTRAENQQHAFDYKLAVPVVGEQNGKSKLTVEDVLNIRNLYNTKNCFYKDLAVLYGISSRHVGSIINRKVWTHI